MGIAAYLDTSELDRITRRERQEYARQRAMETLLLPSRSPMQQLERAITVYEEAVMTPRERAEVRDD